MLNSSCNTFILISIAEEKIIPSALGKYNYIAEAIVHMNPRSIAVSVFLKFILISYNYESKIIHPFSLLMKDAALDVTC